MLFQQIMHNGFKTTEKIYAFTQKEGMKVGRKTGKSERRGWGEDNENVDQAPRLF